MLNKLWSNIGEGDKDAYSQLYVFYFRKLFNYGRKFTTDIPLLEDTIQEVLLGIWINRSKLAGISNPNAYYYTSFRNTLFKKISQVQPDLPNEDPDFSIENILIREEIDLEMKLKLEKAVKNLTPRQAEAIYLRFYEGLSYEEVAVMLGISVKATYKIMARALLQLKTSLDLPYITILMLLQVSHLFSPYPGS